MPRTRGRSSEPQILPRGSIGFEIMRLRPHPRVCPNYSIVFVLLRGFDHLAPRTPGLAVTTAAACAATDLIAEVEVFEPARREAETDGDEGHVVPALDG